LQPSPPLRCEMAVRAAALAQARTAELLGAPAPASHHSTPCSGRCQKQMGPALFAPGNSRAACAIPPAAWPTHRVPARPPPASVLHLPSLLLGAGLVYVERHRGFPGERRRIFSKGQRFLRAHLPFAPSLFVFLYIVLIFLRSCSSISTSCANVDRTFKVARASRSASIVSTIWPSWIAVVSLEVLGATGEILISKVGVMVRSFFPPAA